MHTHTIESAKQHRNRVQQLAPICSGIQLGYWTFTNKCTFSLMWVLCCLYFNLSSKEDDEVTDSSGMDDHGGLGGDVGANHENVNALGTTSTE